MYRRNADGDIIDQDGKLLSRAKLCELLWEHYNWLRFLLNENEFSFKDVQELMYRMQSMQSTVRSHEKQFIQLAEYFGKDACGYGSIAEMVIEEVKNDAT